MSEAGPVGRRGPIRRVRGRARRLRSLPLRSLAPNIATVLALCAGLTSVRLGIEGRYELATIAVLVAAALDGLDGRLARLLRGATRFGAELDSLTDFVNFGVAPVLLLYGWTLSGLGGLGWIVALGYSICCALRLARFNTALDDPDRPAWTRYFFVGVPAPAGAGLAMLPMFLSFAGLEVLREWHLVVALYVALVAFLMVSRIPTFSGKGVRIRRDYVLPILVLVGVFTALVVSYTWMTMSGLMAVYLATIPWSRARCNRYQAEGGPEDEELVEEALSEDGALVDEPEADIGAAPSGAASQMGRRGLS